MIFKKDKHHYGDLIIIGGGAAGLTLACLLGKLGLVVHLVDLHKPVSLKKTKASSRTVAMMQGSLNILKAAGLENIGSEHGASLDAMRIIDDSRQGNALESVFEANDIGLEAFGANIPNSLLKAALFEQASSLSTVQLHYGAGYEDHIAEAFKVTARLENGTKITSPLLIGADGRNSAVRAVEGIKTRARNYHQSAITCLINHSKSHNNIATEFHRPGGPLALVPLPGNRSSIVWVEKTEKADELLRLKKGEFCSALQNASLNMLGSITLEDGPQAWPLKALCAKTLTGRRVALAAEAAHVMSPITAQGLNLSLRDVAALAEIIADAARLGQDIGSDQVLKSYARRRKTDIETRFAGVDSLMQAVSTDSEVVKYLRRTGLKTLDIVTPLKKLAMTHGLAPPIDSGRISRGEAL